MVFRKRSSTPIAPDTAIASNPGGRVFAVVVEPGAALLFSMAEEKDCVLAAEMVTGMEMSWYPPGFSRRV
jgi:hypothetical protein